MIIKTITCDKCGKEIDESVRYKVSGSNAGAKPNEVALFSRDLCKRCLIELQNYLGLDARE